MRLFLESKTIKAMDNTIYSETSNFGRNHGFHFNFKWNPNSNKYCQGIICHGAPDGKMMYRQERVSVHELADILEKSMLTGDFYLISCFQKQKGEETVVSSQGKVKVHVTLAFCDKCTSTTMYLDKGNGYLPYIDIIKAK